jgi:surface-anchored protein
MTTSKKLSALVMSAFALAASPIHAANLFTGEHGDVWGIGYEDGELEPHIHIEGGIVNGAFVDEAEYEPDEIITVVPQSTFDYISSAGGRPGAAAWDAIGVAVGEGFYFLPQASAGVAGADALGAPFVGIGTEELDAGDWASAISIQLLSVSGPGEFSIWQDGLSPNFFMSTADGIDGNDIFTQAAGGHGHVNWGFTQAGNYDITVRMFGTHAVDGLKSADATFAFSVIPEPSTTLFALLGSGLLIMRRRKKVRG